MKPNIRSWRKKVLWIFQEETYQIQRKHWLNKNGIWNVSIVPDSMPHISSSTNSDKLRFLGAKVIIWTRFIIVCLFICKIGFVMFVQCPQWNFLSYWEWTIINFPNIPSQDTFAWIWDEAFIQSCIKLISFAVAQNTRIQNWCCYCGKILINLGENISEAFKGWRHSYICVESPKTRAKKNMRKWPRLFKNGCHWNTNGKENVPAALPAEYLVKT